MRGRSGLCRKTRLLRPSTISRTALAAGIFDVGASPGSGGGSGMLRRSGRDVVPGIYRCGANPEAGRERRTGTFRPVRPSGLGPWIGARVASPRCPILNHVERHKSFVYQEPRWADPVSKTEIEIPIQTRANGRPLRSGCGKPAAGNVRLAERRFEFVPLWQIAVYFVYTMRRVDCPTRGVARRASSLVRRQEPMPPHQNLGVELFSPECCEAGAARLEFQLFSTF